MNEEYKSQKSSSSPSSFKFKADLSLMDQFTLSRRILQGDKDARREFDRRVGIKCDWDDDTDVAFYRSKRRADEREKILDQLAPQRVCPLCQNSRLSSREWVVNKEGTQAVCRSCWMSARGFTLRDAKKALTGAKEVRDPNFISFMDLNVIDETLPRYKLNGFHLSQCREEAGLSKLRFAKLAGWTSSYQTQLETAVKEVRLDTAIVILEVLRGAGVITNDAYSILIDESRAQELLDTYRKHDEKAKAAMAASRMELLKNVRLEIMRLRQEQESGELDPDAILQEEQDALAAVRSSEEKLQEELDELKKLKTELAAKIEEMRLRRRLEIAADQFEALHGTEDTGREDEAQSNISEGP